MLAGWIAAAREAVGEGEGKGNSRCSAIALLHPGLRRGTGCSPALRHAPRGLGPRSAVAAPAPQTHLEIGVVAAQPALGEQGSDVGGGDCEPALSSLNQHMGEARVERDARDGAAVSRELPIAIERAEPRQPLTRLGQRGGGRRIEEREPRRIGLAPQQAGQQQARQVSFEDFGRVMRGQSGGGGFFPQADRDAGALARGAAGALGDGGATGAFGDQPREARPAVVARAAGEAAVDHDADIVERQAGFGDGAGKDEFACARRWRGERGALRGGIDLAVEAVEDDGGG